MSCLTKISLDSGKISSDGLSVLNLLQGRNVRSGNSCVLVTQSSDALERAGIRCPPCHLYIGVMDYDEACFMHLTPGVVHDFPKVVGV